MRLLEFRHNKFNLHLFEADKIPAYAILSHTWGDDENEVKFTDVIEGSGKEKPGYRKIDFCARQAVADKLDFFWVDTCCIKKEDSSELAEAITSMFRWYRNATKCYVYLSDVLANDFHNSNQSVRPWELEFRKSKWFTRGWTLQELIASNEVEFYSSKFKHLGNKRTLEILIHEITGIPVGVLRNEELSEFSDEEKFQWAKSRQTKRPEDRIYSLLGIFDVSLVMNYGEGYEHARRRLENAIKDRNYRLPSFPDIHVDPHEVGKAFNAALIKFGPLIPDEERGVFKKVRIEHVKRMVFNLQREQESKKTLVNCCRLKDFLKSMAIFFEISGSVSDLKWFEAYIWGPMQFMVLKASHYSETFDAILSAYEAIGQELTFLLTNEEIFKRYPLMQRILGWIYSDLLEFHIKAQQYFRRRGWKRFFKADWDDFGTRYQGILANLQRHKNLTESLVRFADCSSLLDINLHIMEKLNAHSLECNLLLAELDKKETEGRDKKYEHVMEWLTSWRPAEAPFKREQVADHESFCEVRKENAGSGDWLLQNKTMTSWMDDDIPINLALWLTGKPGAGKTILASRIIEECEKKSDFITSYFYCKESDPQKKEFLSILKDLLVQMVSQERTLVPYFHMKAKSSGQVTLVAHQLTQSLFKVSCERIRKQFIIVDGLDECPREDRRVLLSFLAQIVDEIEDDRPGALRVLIVSQAEADINERLSIESRTRPNFVVEQIAMWPEHNKDEIAGFVNMWAGRIERRFGLSVMETECIARLISSRTDGMFLYAKLVLENLFNQANKIDVVTELDERKFPVGLAEAYAKILGHLETLWKHNSRVWNRITHLLGLMICAKRPLKRYEIQCAFCLRLDEDEAPCNFERSGLLVHIKELCGTLIQELPGERYLARTKYISKPEVECQLASLCLRYLTQDFFDPDLKKAAVNQFIIDGWLSMQDYVVSKWFQHLNALAKAYKEEEFKVEDSFAALQSLYSSMSDFLDRYIDEISDEEAHISVKTDYAELASQEVYTDLIRVMSHVTRYMEKGPEFRNKICIESLSKAFERNRKLIEELSIESSSTNPGVGKALVQYYGPNHFKCSFVTCINFYEGFSNAKMRKKHVNKHERPWERLIGDIQAHAKDSDRVF
ncbi:hypothetical protein BP6252_13924 [Coleophoma cylindrospora]|uniref:NACHT domain-containing protein n=1 Tax=Coleophoma cylindrospora TaxID=1849047 RepID=A0A3D8Q5B2_9HELO|nr:hypothetical protein BP6252_13924 [Coleophoma cylindrospora]